MPTSSASTIVGATGHQLFRINYPQSKEVSTGCYFLSHSFKVGDCSWRSWLFPNGRWFSSAYMSVFLGLDDAVAEPVKARVRFSLLDMAGNPVPNYTRTASFEYSTAGIGDGFEYFAHKKFLEESDYILDDYLTIRCDVTVLRSTENRLVIVPPPNLHLHLGDLLESKVGADVTLQVADEMFRAHRCVLSARSPIFKAELLSTAREGASTGICIRIDDMDSRVFEKLLHFIYTDSLPEMTEEEEFPMAQHLLVAADRYGMNRLKLICAKTLGDYMDLDTVATLLVLAEKHRCHMLKEDCIEYLRYPPALDAVMALGDGFEHITENCPALLRELWDVWFEDEPHPG